MRLNIYIDLQVGQSAILWSLLARPKLIYGAEVWSPNSETKMKELEQIQAQAAKKAFGKAAAATDFAEAALGDLGWPSVQSQIHGLLTTILWLSFTPARNSASPTGF
jgi:hypothetical protein